MDQGPFLKRTPLKSFEKNGKQLTLNDLMVGADVLFVGRMFHIVDCDQKTRKYFETELSITVDEALPYPRLYSEKDELEKKIKLAREKTEKLEILDKERFNGNFYGNFQKFLKHGKQSLKFLAEWDDSKNNFGEKRLFTIFYYLCDDTIEIREKFRPNSGRGDFKTFLKRSKPLKELSHNEGNETKVGGEGSSYFSYTDFACGRYICINKRQFLLLSCDEETKKFYENVQYPHHAYPHPDLDMILASYSQTKGKKGQKLIDNSENVLNNRKAYKKLQQYGSQVLKMRLKLVSKDKIQSEREFVIAFYLADDQIAMFEPRKRNSGIIGGKFLERGRYINEATGQYFTKEDIKKAIVNDENIHINKRSFVPTFVSKFTQDFFGITYKNKKCTRMSHLETIVKKIVANSDLAEEDDLRFLYEEFLKYDIYSRAYVSLNTFTKILRGLEETYTLYFVNAEIEWIKMKFCSHCRFYYNDFIDALSMVFLLEKLGSDGAKDFLGDRGVTNYGNTVQVEKLMLEKLQNAGENLRNLFRKFDADKSGSLTFTEFRDLLKHFNLILTEGEIAEIMSKYDSDREGTIDYNEFCERIENAQAEKKQGLNVYQFIFLIHRQGRKRTIFT
eukprot:augustus_masked-scaffold_84-processed-gene-0.37-mRNA-1 protein AED:0.90 eAED:0.90 QI:0/-1/0/1/-1/1/1/0/616